VILTTYTLVRYLNRIILCIQVLTPGCGYRRNTGTIRLGEGKKKTKPCVSSGCFKLCEHVSRNRELQGMRPAPLTVAATLEAR